MWPVPGGRCPSPGITRGSKLLPQTPAAPTGRPLRQGRASTWDAVSCLHAGCWHASDPAGHLLLCSRVLWLWTPTCPCSSAGPEPCQMPEEASSSWEGRGKGPHAAVPTLRLSWQLLAEHHQSEATSSKARPGTCTTTS